MKLIGLLLLVHQLVLKLITLHYLHILAHLFLIQIHHLLSNISTMLAALQPQEFILAGCGSLTGVKMQAVTTMSQMVTHALDSMKLALQLDTLIRAQVPLLLWQVTLSLVLCNLQQQDS